MKKSNLFKAILLVVALLVAANVVLANERIARVSQGIFLYSNWNAPYMTLDTCLDMTVKEVHIPDTITVNGRTYPVIEIGPGAFNGCQYMKTFYFNRFIAGLLKGTFLNCPNLRVMVLYQTKPFPIESLHTFYRGKFEDIFEPYHEQSVVIVVPPGSEEAYRNHPEWGRFKHIQSTIPTDEELDNTVIEDRIARLENELEQARKRVAALEAELKALKSASNN